MFPTITHINDVLPAIEGRPEFVVGKRDGYQFIDYNYTQSDSFDCPIRRECRGLKFDLEGNLIARPLHKFFNLHEKPDEVPDFASEHVIMEKLDGSMIHAALVNDELVFMTRAGITDQAKQAMEACKRLPYGEDLQQLCTNLLYSGSTPVFEFTSPANQIVVKYKEEALTLIAIRFNEDGYYSSRAGMERVVARMGGTVPLVRTFDQSAHDLDAFVAHTKGLENMEGYVVRVGQQFVKLKADAYVATHRAKSGLLFEKDVLRLVLENKIDDVLGMLSKDEAEALQDWADRVNTGVSRIAEAAARTWHRVSFQYHTRAEQARMIKDAHPEDNFLRSCCFSVLDGKPALEVVRSAALKLTSSSAKAAEFRKRLGIAEWKPFMFAKLADA